MSKLSHSEDLCVTLQIKLPWSSHLQTAGQLLPNKLVLISFVFCTIFSGPPNFDFRWLKWDFRMISRLSRIHLFLRIGNTCDGHFNVCMKSAGTSRFGKQTHTDLLTCYSYSTTGCANRFVPPHMLAYGNLSNT